MATRSSEPVGDTAKGRVIWPTSAHGGWRTRAPVGPGAMHASPELRISSGQPSGKAGAGASLRQARSVQRQRTYLSVPAGGRSSRYSINFHDGYERPIRASALIPRFSRSK
jgi:hypothetical protein